MFELGDHAESVSCLAIQFFDDIELVLILERGKEQRYLATIDYTALRDEMTALPAHVLKAGWTMEDVADHQDLSHIQVSS